MRRTIPIALLLVAGCAPTWHHPTATQQQFHRDKANCMAQAGKDGSTQPAPQTGNAYMDGYNQGRAISQQDQLFNSCMRGKGYYTK